MAASRYSTASTASTLPGEQAGRVFDRDAQGVQCAEQIAQILAIVSVPADRIHHRGQRWDVTPNHRDGAEFQVQRVAPREIR